MTEYLDFRYKIQKKGYFNLNDWLENSNLDLGHLSEDEFLNQQKKDLLLIVNCFTQKEREHPDPLLLFTEERFSEIKKKTRLEKKQITEIVRIYKNFSDYTLLKGGFKDKKV